MIKQWILDTSKTEKSKIHWFIMVYDLHFLWKQCSGDESVWYVGGQIRWQSATHIRIWFGKLVQNWNPRIVVLSGVPRASPTWNSDFRTRIPWGPENRDSSNSWHFHREHSREHDLLSHWILGYIRRIYLIFQTNLCIFLLKIWVQIDEMENEEGTIFWLVEEALFVFFPKIPLVKPVWHPRCLFHVLSYYMYIQICDLYTCNTFNSGFFLEYDCLAYRQHTHIVQASEYIYIHIIL
jgi:hypothetical protein